MEKKMKKTGKSAIKFHDGHTEVHFDGVFNEHTLCHQDMSGDGGWDTATPTNKKVDCAQCIAIVEYCKKLTFN